MCACRVDAKSSPSTPGSVGSLSEYLPYLRDMEQRNMEETFPDPPSADVEGDLCAQLVKKEQDLVLAAQLGKALLEKNEYLSKRTDQLNEEIEDLTQERHSLRLKLESKESEYETTVRELQADISQLREQLQHQSEQARESYRAKSCIVNELTQQNERLTEQIKKGAQREEVLQLQVQNFKKSVLQRRSSINEHVHQLVVLREEITMLTERRDDLERRLGSMTEERHLVSSNLEESQDRIMMLEKQSREQEQQLRTQEREIGELQEQNMDLQDKLEALSLRTSSPCLLETTQNSLYNELEMSQMSSPVSAESLDFASSLKIGQPRLSQPFRPNSLFVPGMGVSHHCHHDDDEDIECDEVAMVTGRANTPCAEGLDSMFMAKSPRGNCDMDKLKQEVLEVHRHLQRMVCDLQGHDWSPENDTDGSTLQNGSLIGILTDLKTVLQDIVHRPLDMDTHSLDSMNTIESQVKSLHSELSSTQQEVEKLKANLQFKDGQLLRKSEELTELTGKMSLQHQELIHLQLERDQLQDQSAGISRDEIVEQTRLERNEALEKKNLVQQELASAKLDMMNLEQQLMDAIQQKVELSQQLEQWEVDMHELLGAQMAKQIDQEKRLDEAKAKTKTPSPKKKKSIFSRR